MLILHGDKRMEKKSKEDWNKTSDEQRGNCETQSRIMELDVMEREKSESL